MTKREDTIQMSVGGLTLDPVTKTPIVILKDTENKLNLPIWIGLLEATAMATEIEGIKMARPMTHDLLKTILGHRPRHFDPFNFRGHGCGFQQTDPDRQIKLVFSVFKNNYGRFGHRIERQTAN